MHSRRWAGVHVRGDQRITPSPPARSPAPHSLSGRVLRRSSAGSGSFSSSVRYGGCASNAARNCGSSSSGPSPPATPPAM
jgi:hypothetical protein